MDVFWSVPRGRADNRVFQLCDRTAARWTTPGIAAAGLVTLTTGTGVKGLGGSHGLRHSYARLWLQSGLNVNAVSAWQGRSSPTVTTDPYLVLAPDTPGGHQQGSVTVNVRTWVAPTPVLAAGIGRAIITLIAQRTPVRKQALQAHFPASGGPKNPLRKRVALPPAQREHPVLLIYRVRSRVGAASAQWIGIHSNGIHTYPLEWIGIQCIGVHSIPMQFIPGRVAVPTPVGGKGQPNHGVVSLQFR